MEGLHTHSQMESVKGLEGMKARQEASSFVLTLRVILSRYGLNIKSAKEDIFAFTQKTKDDLIASISNLIKERGFYYVNGENERIVNEVKKMTGDTIGSLVEKLAFGDAIEVKTMHEVVEREAQRISIEIEDEALLVSKKDSMSLHDKTREMESFIEKELVSATNDTKWNPKNIRELFSRIMDFVKDTWNGFKIEDLILKVGKNIVVKKEEEFTKHKI